MNPLPYLCGQLCCGDEKKDFGNLMNENNIFMFHFF